MLNMEEGKPQNVSIDHKTCGNLADLDFSLFFALKLKKEYMRRSKYISICNQKGGVGKSSFTILLASSLYYEKGLKVGIIDCDYPQHSIVKFRKWESEQVKSNSYYNKLAESFFTSFGRPVYPVIGAKPENALTLAAELEERSKDGYDITFFDLPGTVNNVHVLEILDNMDYYFTPIEANLPVLESALNFAVAINEDNKSRGKSSRVNLFWNKIDKRERNPLYERYESEVINPLELSVLKSTFPLSSRFRKVMNGETRQFLISTIFPATSQSVKDTDIDVVSFVNEISSIIQLNKNGENSDDKERV